MGFAPPWTDVGRLQADIDEIRNTLRRKAEGHDVSALASRLDSLEHTLREISTEVTGFRDSLQALEERREAAEIAGRKNVEM